MPKAAIIAIVEEQTNAAELDSPEPERKVSDSHQVNSVIGQLL